MTSSGNAVVQQLSQNTLGSYPAVGLAMRFEVKVDDLNLGHWHACKGLNMKIAVKHVEQGGEYRHRTLLPDRVTYEQITLERAMSRPDSQVLQDWLKTIVTTSSTYPEPEWLLRRHATITLLDYQLCPVMEWTLDHVYPTAWSGPTLGANDNKVAMETLVLAHEGFLS